MAPKLASGQVCTVGHPDYAGGNKDNSPPPEEGSYSQPVAQPNETCRKASRAHNTEPPADAGLAASYGLDLAKTEVFFPTEDEVGAGK